MLTGQSHIRRFTGIWTKISYKMYCTLASSQQFRMVQEKSPIDVNMFTADYIICFQLKVELRYKAV